MTTVYGLAVDGSDGTECLMFNTDAERTDWIWNNCVEVWRDGEKLEGNDHLAAVRVECDDDWTIPMERGQWAEMCGISLTDHEIPPCDLSAKLLEAETLLSDISTMLDGEEESVREEHADLAERLEAYQFSGDAGLTPAPGPKIAEAKAVIDQLVTQIEQMQGMFDDEDGTIQAALDDAEAWAND